MTCHDLQQLSLYQPGRLVSHARVALEFQGRYVVLGLGEQVHGQVPVRERQPGHLKYRSADGRGSHGRHETVLVASDSLRSRQIEMPARQGVHGMGQTEPPANVGYGCMVNQSREEVLVTGFRIEFRPQSQTGKLRILRTRAPARRGDIRYFPGQHTVHWPNMKQLCPSAATDVSTVGARLCGRRWGTSKGKFVVPAKHGRLRSMPVVMR